MGLIDVQRLSFAVYATGIGGQVDAFNAAASEFWGFRPPEGRTHYSDVWRLFHPDGSAVDPERFPVAISLREGRSLRHNRFIAERQDGSRVPILTFTQPARDPAGEIIGALESFVEGPTVDARETAEAHLAAIIAASEDAIISKTLDGRITSWNAAAARIFGYEPAEMVGQPIMRIIPEPMQEEEAEIIARLSRGERIEHFETIRLRKDGRPIAVALSISPVRNAAGNVIGAAKIARDISDRLEAEQRLRQLQWELAHAARLSSMGELVGAIAHELKQPLTAISNYLGAARRMLNQAAAPETRILEVLERAMAQTTRAGLLIERLRTFISKGERTLSLVSFGDLVDEALEILGPLRAGVVTRVEIDKDLPQMTVDKVQIQQVIVNIARNAIEAMHDCSVKELTIKVARQGQATLLVTIADTGPGVSPEIAANLFKAFATTKSSGMGVGLSICRSIIEAHGGTIWAKPGPRGGSVFGFSLPIDQTVYE